jgi:hypothetical protein
MVNRREGTWAGGDTGRVLPDDDRRRFSERGFLVLRGAVGPPVLGPMRDEIWSALAGAGARRDQPATWPRGAASNLRSVRSHDRSPAECEALTTALDGIFGAGEWKPPTSWGQVMVTFPEPGPWSTARCVWHIDHPFWFPASEIWGVNVFLFVDDVGPRGGATLAVEGSPRLIERFVRGIDPSGAKPRALLRRFRAEHPWLERAIVGTVGEGSVDTDGPRSRVVELTGSAGDAVVCHPWLLHAAAPNASRRPRIMRTSRVYRRSRPRTRTPDDGAQDTTPDA